MKKRLSAGAILLLSTSVAQAGGLDRSGQPIGAIFEDGTYVELSFGQVMPDVSGELIVPGPATLDSGTISPDYTSLGFAFKTQINEQVSLALIFDQPYGADVDYETAGYLLTGTAAQVKSKAITGLARYEFNENYSVHGGIRFLSAEGDYLRTPVALPPPIGLIPGYQSNYSQGSGAGFVLGGAYERPEIALRIAMTYSSEIDLDLPGSNGDLSTTMPESVNLDFQTGVAADTLLFGSVRYVAWEGFALTDSVDGDILNYDDDVVTYNIGIGRQLSSNFAGSFSVGYEASTGEPTSNLGPTDGFISYQIGGAYTLDNGVEISGGIRYVDIGDATTTIGAEFEDNSAIGLGLKVAYAY